MKINVKNFKNDLNKLNNSIEEYWSTTLNLYNELSYSSNYWHDPKSITFYDNINFEKKKNIEIINELEELRNIYNELITKYEIYGNNIKCIIDKKYDVIYALNEYISGLNKILKQYQRLDIKSTQPGYYYILKQAKTVKDDYQKMLEVKKHISSIFDNINNIEKDINLKISKIKINYLKESSYIEYL